MKIVDEVFVQETGTVFCAVEMAGVDGYNVLTEQVLTQCIGGSQRNCK